MARHRRWVWLRHTCGVVGVTAVFATGEVLAECKGEDGGSSVVTEIREGETLILGDGRTVRLANLITPKRAHGGQKSEARDGMEKALADLVLNKKVELKLGESKRDRYGRLLAQVVVAGDGGPVWVQDKLVSTGQARVMASGDGTICLRELISHENQAREAQRGLWKNGYFAVRTAASEDMLIGLVHSYEIVEGQVQSVATVRGRTYLNFGSDWRRDFTAMVPEKNAKLLGGDAGMADAAKLKGQTVRVRGWIDNFNGPSITINQPEQIEILASALPSQ